MTLPLNPEELSLGALRALVEAEGANCPARFLAALEADGRRGAREIASRERRRRGRARRESERLRGLLRFERACWKRGLSRVAGVDEVGMGPLAGPVVAAAVILRPERSIERLAGLDDSKRLDRKRRERLAGLIEEEALAVALGRAEVSEIGSLDIHAAGLLAMRRAVLALDPLAEHLLVDAREVPELQISQEAHVKGDARSASIAAASIVAKVHRDGLMAELALQHPGYGFERHQGYGSAEHLEALRLLGPCPAHRTSWDALSEHAGRWSPTYYRLRELLPEAPSASPAGALASVAGALHEAESGWRAALAAAGGELDQRERRKLELLAARRFRRERARPGA